MEIINVSKKELPTAKNVSVRAINYKKSIFDSYGSVINQHSSTEQEGFLIKYGRERQVVPLKNIAKGRVAVFKYLPRVTPNTIIKTTTHNGKIFYIYNSTYRHLCITENSADIYGIKLHSKMLRVTQKRGHLYIKIAAYMTAANVSFTVSNVHLMVGELPVAGMSSIVVRKNKMSMLQMMRKRKKIIKTISFPLESLIDDEEYTGANNQLHIKLSIDNVEVRLPIRYMTSFERKNRKYNYLPFACTTYRNSKIYFRKSVGGTLTLVKRPFEPVETNLFFKFMESNIISHLLYNVGRIVKRFIKINLYFEKYAGKAEEGTFELFEKIIDSARTTLNYFIIDKQSPDYEKIRWHKNVIKKYSMKYYITLYAASAIISPETQMHINILRSNNRSLRKSLYQKKFVFLQHGITYLKAQDSNSSLGRGRDAEPDLMIVSSHKETAAVMRMLNIPKERLLISGMPIFDNVRYQHINARSKDIISIMLTWRPYDEHLTDITKTTFYQDMNAILKIVSKCADKRRIRIIPHPKLLEIAQNSVISNMIDSRPIKDILSETKLLITDYSSVCYNVFHQGGGVVFFQSDLERYEAENGELVPRSNEYIGYRVFNPVALSRILRAGIQEKHIDLSYFRTKKFIQNYNLINEFHDGKNTDRIVEALGQHRITRTEWGIKLKKLLRTLKRKLHGDYHRTTQNKKFETS